MLSLALLPAVKHPVANGAPLEALRLIDHSALGTHPLDEASSDQAEADTAARLRVEWAIAFGGDALALLPAIL
jgi:hypothetical protein